MALLNFDVSTIVTNDQKTSLLISRHVCMHKERCADLGIGVVTLLCLDMIHRTYTAQYAGTVSMHR